MPRQKLFRLAPLVLASCIAMDALGAQRVFVRSNGTDTGSCTLAAPCRGFTYALTQVDAGGEIVALDAAGYGAVTITKSVTITTNGGYFAGISAGSGNAVTVDAPEATVVLSGLHLNGLNSGQKGIHVVNAYSVTVENAVITNFLSAGLQVDVPAQVRLAGSTIRMCGAGDGAGGAWFRNGAQAVVVSTRSIDNAGAGFLADRPDGPGITRVSIQDSVASRNAKGFWAYATGGAGEAMMSVRRSSGSFNVAGVQASNGGARVAVAESQFAHNDVAFFNDGGATFESYSNNQAISTATSTGEITSIGPF